MGQLLRKAQTRAGAVVIGAGLLAVGGTATAAVMVTSPPTDEVSDVTTVTTEPATTTAPETTQAPQVAPQAVPEVTPIEDPPVSQPAATVQDVTEPEPAPQIPEGHRLPDLAPGQDPEGVGTIGPDGNYTPAPNRQNPGEPPPGKYVPPPAEEEIPPPPVINTGR